jgi:hypothetical protein
MPATRDDLPVICRPVLATVRSSSHAPAAVVDTQDEAYLSDDHPSRHEVAKLCHQWGQKASYLAHDLPSPKAAVGLLTRRIACCMMESGGKGE